MVFWILVAFIPVAFFIGWKQTKSSAIWSAVVATFLTGVSTVLFLVMIGSGAANISTVPDKVATFPLQKTVEGGSEYFLTIDTQGRTSPKASFIVEDVDGVGTPYMVYLDELRIKHSDENTVTVIKETYGNGWLLPWSLADNKKTFEVHVPADSIRTRIIPIDE